MTWKNGGTIEIPPFLVGTPSGVFTATSCLPSCARLSRARTMSLHRRLIPFCLSGRRAVRRFVRQNGQQRTKWVGVNEVNVGFEPLTVFTRKNRVSFLIPCFSLVHHQGFEPWTPWLRVRCSASWANGAYLFYFRLFFPYRTIKIIPLIQAFVNNFFHFISSFMFRIF